MNGSFASEIAKSHDVSLHNKVSEYFGKSTPKSEQVFGEKWDLIQLKMVHPITDAKKNQICKGSRVHEIFNRLSHEKILVQCQKEKGQRSGQVQKLEVSLEICLFGNS